jgi:diguanylate cyclase (GGDEF)-like protein
MRHMRASLTISSTAPGRGQLIAALLTTTVLLVVAGVALPMGSATLPPCPGFLPAFGGMKLISDLVTAALLFGQAQAAQNRSTAQLGAAYLFSVMAIVPHLLAFPGVFAAQSIIGASPSATWLWCFWHAGFALCVVRYALRHGRVGAGPLRLTRNVAAVAAAVFGLTMLATAGLPYLPQIIQGGGYARLDATGVGPAVLACNVAALAIVLVRLRGRSTLDLWLAVAMLTATLDVLLGLYGGGRFTLGWYVSRLLSLGTGVTVPVALLSEVTVLFRRISGLNEHLQHLTVTDALTQIANRRGFDDALERAWRDAEREETAVSLLMVDIDHFKGFNDAYGHPAGDECLRRVASLINSHARRPYDIAARLGGEEFVLLMPQTEEAGAAMIAARLRAGLEGLLIPNAASRLGHVTISGGIATLRPCARRRGHAELVAAADHALYRAKQDGRNRVAVFAEPAAPPSEPARQTAARAEA